MSRRDAAIEDLDQPELVNFAIDVFHRSLIHYGLWFREAEYHLGLERAVEADERTFETGLPIIMRRLGKVLGFEVDEKGVPLRLKEMERQELLDLIKAQSANWLAFDGVWFQAVESQFDMATAKRLNDSCWTRYAPYEAQRIKRITGLEENSGLAGLKTALGFRTYSMLNRHTIQEIDEKSFIFQINDCRVQSARKRRGLPDYPCKSAGTVEYPYFAWTVDRRIETECVGCPPDEHPDEWFCAWKFTIQD